MVKYDFDIGVIGAGAAGLTAAAGSARWGAKTLLIEKRPELGGDCLHFGCVPSKTLINTAKIYHYARNGPQFGLPEFSVPPVDFSAVAARIRTVIETIQPHDSVERFCGLGVRVEFGSASFRDEHAVSVNGNDFTAKTWIVATGSNPKIPPLPGLDRTPYLTNETIFSLDRLPRSLIIIGAGPIGVEMAQAFSRLGTEVSVIHRSGQILNREDPDMARLVQERLTSDGVTFHLDATVRSVRSEAGDIVVDLEQPDHSRVVRGENILLAVGRQSCTSGLGLEALGMEINHGLKVDSRLRTAHKHIFAAGDVLGKYLFTHAAGYEAGVVLANAVLHLPRRVNYKWLPWCTYVDPELASIGLNEKAAREAGLTFSVWKEKFFDNDRSQAEGETEGVIKLLLDHREKTLGVQIFGSRAGELLAEWVAVVNGKIGLSTLASSIHPYPTLGEINKQVAGQVIGRKLFSEPVRKGLKWFFNLKGRACD